MALPLGNLVRGHDLLHLVAQSPRRLNTLGSGKIQPTLSRHQAFRDNDALAIAHAQIVLRLGVALVRGPAKPFHDLDITFRNVVLGAVGTPSQKGPGSAARPCARMHRSTGPGGARRPDSGPLCIR
jgi:hypothetical protein